jgi:ABC-type branched-subunit amino acid transport system ATPase component
MKRSKVNLHEGEVIMEIHMKKDALETSETLNTSRYTKQEAAEIIRDKLSRTPILILIGPQGGGKTTLAIESLDENTGAYFEGHVRAAQPVILIRRDAVEKLKNTIVERRPLPIYDGDEQLYTEVTAYDTIKSSIETIFDIFELGEVELAKKIRSIAAEHGLDTQIIEVIAEPDDLRQRRLHRKDDAPQRLEKLLEKEKKYQIESNIMSIQGAKILDIVHRDKVGSFADDEISRTLKDFNRIIPTEGKTLKECMQLLMKISKEEKRESGFLVLHKHKKEQIISDIVVGGTRSIIGVTMLEVYVGFRQQGLAAGGVYKPDIEGVIEVIHSHHGGDKLLSPEDYNAAERFGIIVTVVEAEGNIASTYPPRRKMLQRLLNG